MNNLPLFANEPKRGFQGVWIPAALWEHPNLSWMEKCLAAEIDSLSSAEHGPCNAGSEFLANRMGTTPGMIRKMISDLMAKDVVWQLGSDGRSTWRSVAARYSCNQDKYRVWMGDQRCAKDLDERCAKDLRCYPEVTSDVTKRSHQKLRGGNTEIPSEIPIEQINSKKSLFVAGKPLTGIKKSMADKKKKSSDGQLPLPNVAEALEINQAGRPPGMPSLAVLRSETARLQLPDSDADFLYDAWLANGFRTKTGKIRDWKASLRNYIRNSWLPSLKRANKFTERDREAEELLLVRRAKERQERYEKENQ